MPMNNAQTRLINPILTSIALGYRNAEHVGYSLFPSVNVAVAGGQVIEFGKESFRLYNARRAPGGATKRVEFGYLGKPYALVQDALEGLLPRERIREAQVPGIDLGKRTVASVQDILSLALEHEQAQLATTAANYDANHKIALAGDTKWSHADSDPGAQMETAKEAVRATTGMYPNTLLLSASAASAARRNKSIREQHKYTSSDVPSDAALAAYFGVDRVVVGKAVTFNDAGVATDVWGNTAVLAYVPLTASTQETPSFGYTYVMDGHPLVEKEYYDSNTKSWVYPVTFERAAQITAATAGYLFTNVK